MQKFIDYLYAYSEVIGIAFESILVFLAVALVVGFIALICLIVAWVTSVNETINFIDDNFYSIGYVLRNFDKFAKDTANNTVICNELKCQKSAKDSSRK